jgi:transcriptional regulator with XRE-family HTH domain
VARPVSSQLKRQQNTLQQALGAAITDLRTQRDWSQQVLADRLGYVLSYINSLERGKQNPSFKLIVAMAQVFGIRPSQLLARAERKQARG